MKIVAHTLVKNEENFIWFAINSVIECVDKIMVWDNGSTDKTVKIVRSINSSKIELKECGPTDKLGTAQLRQQMLEETDEDWIFLLDGDEVWWNDNIEKLVSDIKNAGEAKIIVSSPYMLTGDIYHFREDSYGRYVIAGRMGNFNIRAIKKTPGLHVEGYYPNEAYLTHSGIPVQNLPAENMLFSDYKYLHASNIQRSSSREPRYYYDLGIPFPKDFYYPEVFFRNRPEIVPSPWEVRSKKEHIISLACQPARRAMKEMQNADKKTLQ